jgi:hypothetical protein
MLWIFLMEINYLKKDNEAPPLKVRGGWGRYEGWRSMNVTPPASPYPKGRDKDSLDFLKEEKK